MNEIRWKRGVPTEEECRECYLRLRLKFPLRENQKGRTHKRKQRGQRKVANMTFRQWVNHFSRRRL